MWDVRRQKYEYELCGVGAAEASRPTPGGTPRVFDGRGVEYYMRSTPFADSGRATHYEVIPCVSAMNAVSRLISSSLNSVSR